MVDRIKSRIGVRFAENVNNLPRGPSPDRTDVVLPLAIDALTKPANECGQSSVNLMPAAIFAAAEAVPMETQGGSREFRASPNVKSPTSASAGAQVLNG
jgi:hypothetical protein